MIMKKRDQGEKILSLKNFEKIFFKITKNYYLNKPSQKWSVYPKAGDIKRPFKPIWTVMPHDSCVIMDGQSTKSERSRMKN